MLADLRGSGKLEQEANHVIFVHRPDQFGLQGSPEIIIAKQRNGPQATVPVVFEAESCVFRPARPIAA
jgi:replicative DNA helicase